MKEIERDKNSSQQELRCRGGAGEGASLEQREEITKRENDEVQGTSSPDHKQRPSGHGPRYQELPLVVLRKMACESEDEMDAET